MNSCCALDSKCWAHFISEWLRQGYGRDLGPLLEALKVLKARSVSEGWMHDFDAWVDQVLRLGLRLAIDQLMVLAFGSTEHKNR